ncbi:MAG: CPBP family intramembrane metalloprotease [Microbacteriaceae bacterium]|nr:CPBP family intramembrane metalloprotease [Microbacteriaceae bacterium]
MQRIRSEIVVVLLLSYGMSALYSLVGIANRLSQPTPLSQQTATLNRPLATQELFDLLYQLLGVASGLAPIALVLWLVWRDSPPRFGAIGLGWSDGFAWRKLSREFAAGFGLAALIGIPGIGVYLAARALNLGVTVVPTALDAHWWTVPVLILWALRAGLGEEIIVVGYLFDRLRAIGWTPWLIIVSAAVLRGTYHLYQGFGGFAGNIAMGLIFGAIYLRTKRLAPLIVAHVLIDITAFVGYPLALILFPGVFA